MAQNLTVEDSKNYIRRKLEEGSANIEFTWGIKDMATHGVVGLVILKELRWLKGIGELAYCLDQNYEGKGWISRAVEYVSMMALNDHGLKFLQIIVHRTNMGSIRVAEKCGYRWKCTLKNEYTAPNTHSLDMELYELHKTNN